MERSKGPATSAATMPNFSGNWKIIRSENFEDLLKVLGKEIFDRRGEKSGCRGIGGGYEKERVLAALDSHPLDMVTPDKGESLPGFVN